VRAAVFWSGRTGGAWMYADAEAVFAAATRADDKPVPGYFLPARVGLDEAELVQLAAPVYILPPDGQTTCVRGVAVGRLRLDPAAR
jgi:hypothetical protein